MKYLKKQIRKNQSKNDYVIGIGAKDISEADEDKYFYRNKKGKFVSDVIIYYDEDHAEIQKEFRSLEDTIANKNKTIETHQNELTAIHSDHKKEIKIIQDEFNAEIDKLNRDLSAKDLEIHNLKSEYDGKIASLKLQHEKDISDLKQSLLEKHHSEESAITSKKQKEIDTLNNTISANEVQHERDISNLKQTYSDEVHKLDNNYKSTLVRLRTEDNNDISDYNKKLSRIKKDLEDLGFFEKHSHTYKDTLSELDEAIDEFEKTNKNKLLAIDEDFAKLPTKKSDEANEGNE